MAAHRQAIIDRFPHILRRVSGYNLDEFVPGLPVRPVGWVDEPWRFNLARLIVGSEGSLAVVTAAELKVVPIPAAQGLVVLSFATIPAALDRLAEIVATGPVAVEMLDRMILELAAENPLYSHYLNFAEGRPAAVLAAQFYADSQDELAARADDLARRFEGRPGVLGIRKRLTTPPRTISGRSARPGSRCSWPWSATPSRSPSSKTRPSAPTVSLRSTTGSEPLSSGMASGGVLRARRRRLSAHPADHQRQDPEGVATLRSIAREISDLVVEFGGSMSGEHGDGLARSLWNPKLFGPEVYAAFRQVKRAFDPENLLNPGKVVGDADPGDNLRIGPDYHPHEPAETLLDFSGQGGFARAVEMCSGVGACRKTATGTMCPSYMVTRDEMHTTRGRANALRLAMTGELPSPARAGQRDPPRGPRPLPSVQGVQERMPVQGRHGQAQGRGAAPVLPSGPGPWVTCSWATSSGSTRSVRPWLRWPTRRSAIRRSSGFWKRPPGSTGGGPCRRSSATISGNGSAITG